MKIRRKIEKLNSNTTNIVVSNGENASYQDRNTRLRKLNIKTFTGKPTEWPTFIEPFETAVDSNGALSNIQKFQYLKCYLPGQVERCIEGFLLTNDNYREARNLLKERFGNTQLIINTHVSQLMKLGIVEEGNVSKLRNFFNTAESHAQALSNQGVNKEHFGAISLRVELSRKRGKDNWKLERFLELLRIEIEARDKSETEGNPPAKSKQEEPLTLQTLMSALDEKFEQKNKGQFSKQKEKVCLFCKEQHYSDKCSKVKNVDDRREILKKNRYCFKCMKPGHSKANCKGRVKCFKCQSFGHHTALCRNIEKLLKKTRINQQIWMRNKRTFIII